MKISRRDMLAGASAGLAAGIGSLTAAGPAGAAMRCSNWRPFNYGMIRNCTVGVRVPRLRAQACPQWCWAACIQSAFKIGGYSVSQERIVEKIFGTNFNCRTATGPEIFNAVRGSWTDDDGDSFYADCDVLADLMFGIVNPQALQEASYYLRDDIPLINGALGHATLMTAISWVEDNFGQQRLMEIIVRDPWPGNRSRRQLTGQEFANTFFVAAVTVS